MTGFSGPVNLFFSCRLFLAGGPILTGGAGAGFGGSSSFSGEESSTSSLAFRFLRESTEAGFRWGDSDLDAEDFPRVDLLLRERTVCLGARPRLGGGGEDECSDSGFC